VSEPTQAQAPAPCSRSIVSRPGMDPLPPAIAMSEHLTCLRGPARVQFLLDLGQSERTDASPDQSPSTAKVLLGAVHSAQHTEGLAATIVSVVTLAIGSTTVLAALQAALEVIWASQKLAISGIRGWIRTRLMSFGFILTLGFLLLISLTISTAVTSLRTHIASAYPALVAAIAVIDFTLSLAAVAGLFALIYRYTPARRLPWRIVIAGGLLTAVLFDAGRWVVGLYLAHATQPSAYGAASSFAALLLWLYYTAQIFLFGAEFTSCLAGLRSEGAGASDRADKLRSAAGSRAESAACEP
jgi:membrane protein